MLSSADRENLCNCHHKIASSSSSSLSSSPPLSSSSPFQFSSNKPLFPPSPRAGGGKTMEEVWKDINLSSLHNHQTITTTPCRPNHHSSSFRPTLLQDFLARPFTTTTTDSHNNPSAAAAADGSMFGSSPPPPMLMPRLAPGTILSLNSGAEFRFLDNSEEEQPPSSSRQQTSATAGHPINRIMTSEVSPLDVFASSSSGFLHPFGNNSKRFSESDGGPAGDDQRHKRMIKNRESAARSRARKQAYTNELEREVAHLMEENARLKRQQQQLCLAAASQLPKKQSTLYRTSTAPF